MFCSNLKWSFRFFIITKQTILWRLTSKVESNLASSFVKILHLLHCRINLGVSRKKFVKSGDFQDFKNSENVIIFCFSFLEWKHAFNLKLAGFGGRGVKVKALVGWTLKKIWVDTENIADMLQITYGYDSLISDYGKPQKKSSLNGRAIKGQVKGGPLRKKNFFWNFWKNLVAI